MPWRFTLIYGLLLLAIFLILGMAQAALVPAGDQIQHWIFLTIAILLALSVLWFLSVQHRGQLMEAIRELTESMEQISLGKSSPRLYVHEKDEIARLIHVHNRMSRRITRRIHQLEEQHRQLDAILTGMIEGVVALDAQQRILFVNGRARGLLELKDAPVVGRKLWDAVRHRPLIDIYQRAFKENEPQHEEMELYGPSNRSLAVYAAPLGSETAPGAVLVISDTTELRQLERMRQQFVANVSHELKTPLAVIRPNVETLLGGVSDPEVAQGFLREILSQTDRLHRLILDLLSLARIESGAEVFTFEEVDVAEMVENCLNRNQKRAHAKEQQLVIEESPEEAWSWIDEEALRQILDNLIDNALKYTPEKGRISLRWWIEKGQVHVQVRDSGMGIPEADLPRIFERFYRVDKARSRALGGTGLGLSIVKHLAQAMNGTIDVESQVNVGTTFTIHLPLYESPRRGHLSRAQERA